MTQTPTDLIWIQTSFLGDIILTTAAIELAYVAFPGVRQHLVTTKVGADALAEHPRLSSITVFKKGKGNTLVAFRAVHQTLRPQLLARQTSVILQAHRSYRSSFLTRYLRFKWGASVITYDETDAGFLATTRVPRVAVLHEAARVALLLEPLGVTREQIAQARPTLAALPLVDSSITDSALSADLEPAWVRRLAEPSMKLVGLAPGSMWGTKRWTKKGFVELCRRLLADPRITLVMLGSDKEAPLARSILNSCDAGERGLDLCGKTSLRDLRRVYPKLSLLISNDSSPVHYASAFNVPTVAVFGATIPEMGFGPLADGSASVGLELACRPCSDHGPQICPLGHFKCMRKLSATSVYAACRKIIDTW